MNSNLPTLIKQYPVIQQIIEAQEITWINSQLTDTRSALKKAPVTMQEISDANTRLLRFAPFIRKCFADTETTDGVIESPLRDISGMKAYLNDQWDACLKGRLLLKMDSHLAVAGSVKARGGIYEILKYAEDLAVSHGRIGEKDNYEKFTYPEMKDFFSKYAIHVGSTGNLGLSIGIISAKLGFQVNVHMSSDAKQWKKDLLRTNGVNVIEYGGDYSQAVARGREMAQNDPKGYFVDDENSKNLFLGYSVAAIRLEGQLKEHQIKVDERHPLFVYIPCGVGGAPGGITFGLKQIYGDNVYPFFVEPTQACCMALGMITDLHSGICVQDVGLSGETEADGLAVGRPSRFVGKTIRHLLAGEFTVSDKKLYGYMKALMDTEEIFIEPSACAAFEGPTKLYRDSSAREFLAEKDLLNKAEDSTHIVWATGGSLVPIDIKKEYYQKAVDLSEADS